jgi:TRAP-type mannitol/chloroaromatic compound transport system substrate-binding protein
LPESYRAALEAACAEATVLMMAKYDTRNPEALRRLVAAGVQLRQFPRPVLDACYKAAFETYDELAGRSADFKLIYESWQKFLADSNLWFRIAENTLDNYRFAMSAQPR